MPKNYSQTVQAHAKVNLALRITNRRSDGYHDISSIFQEIELHDRITFTPAREYRLHCNHPALPVDATNLCTRAYLRMKMYAPSTSDYHLYLEKQIPVGAGLGGGSSDAAAVLKFLNQAWGLNFDTRQLVKVASSIGADIPFYIQGKTQLAEGIGDKLRPIQLPESFVLLLVCPDFSISTAWAYRQFDLTLKQEAYKFSDLFSNATVNWSLFENQFEAVVFPAYPETGWIKQALLNQQALYAGLSGSGSTVFGVFHNNRKAARVLHRFSTYTTFVTLPILC
jgi:4-diphosphocytidyl-2-C-methyl-D-erythritol kinase